MMARGGMEVAAMDVEASITEAMKMEEEKGR